MAKSSRSKWKKLHRRQQAKEEASNTVKRIQMLHKKLELTIKGGISAVPPQEPETRFHFLNPELDPRVPNTRKDLNNNYRAELNQVQYDYTRPLQLSAPKTNMYGKTDVVAPHRMTQDFETVDADAPIAGHALTKEDMERFAQKELTKTVAAAAAAESAANEEEEGAASDSGEPEDEDGPEEFVFGMEDTAPRRAKFAKQAAKAKKSSTAVAGKSKISSGGAAAALRAAAAAAAAMSDEETSTAAVTLSSSSGGKTSKKHAESSSAPTTRIASMAEVHKRNGVNVAASGASKMKKVGNTSGASGTRLVSGGGKTASKKMGDKKKK